MKRIALVMTVAIVPLFGCTSTTRRSAAVDDVDHAHVAAVENAARNTGVTVHWINLPRRRDEAANAAPAPSAPTGT